MGSQQTTHAALEFFILQNSSWPFLLKKKLFYFNWRIIPLQCCKGILLVSVLISAIHQQESATGMHMPPPSHFPLLVTVSETDSPWEFAVWLRKLTSMLCEFLPFMNFRHSRIWEHREGQIDSAVTQTGYSVPSDVECLVELTQKLWDSRPCSFHRWGNEAARGEVISKISQPMRMAELEIQTGFSFISKPGFFLEPHGHLTRVGDGEWQETSGQLLSHLLKPRDTTLLAKAMCNAVKN